MDDVVAIATTREDLVGSLTDDYARFFLLKASDLGVGASDFDRLSDFCHAAFFSLHAAAMAWTVSAMVQQSLHPPVTRLKILNYVSRLRGLPEQPIPAGSPLEAAQALLPILEILVERSGSDLRIRRVLQFLNTHDCGKLPTGKWDVPTAHKAGFGLAQDVLREMLLATIGLNEIAVAQERSVPRFVGTIIQAQHWPQLRRQLRKFCDIDLVALMQSIDSELAYGFKVCASLPSHVVVKKTKILFYAADSAEDGSERLRLDKEVRAIRLELQASPFREQLAFDSWWDAHAEDLSQQLLLQSPRIVHFGMHGRLGHVAFAATAPQDLFVSGDAILQLFRAWGGQVDMVLFTACDSSELAKALVDHVDAAIGMSGEISDDGAVAFSRGFYRGAFAGRSVREAFELGLAEVTIQCPADRDLPQLFCRVGVDPTKLLLVDSDAGP